MSKIIYTDVIKLYLAGVFDANDEINLKKKNINTIICVAEDAKNIS